MLVRIIIHGTVAIKKIKLRSKSLGVFDARWWKSSLLKPCSYALSPKRQSRVYRGDKQQQLRDKAFSSMVDRCVPPPIPRGFNHSRFDSPSAGGARGRRWRRPLPLDLFPLLPFFLLPFRAATGGRSSSGPVGRDSPSRSSVSRLSCRRTRMAASFCGDSRSQKIPEGFGARSGTRITRVGVTMTSTGTSCLVSAQVSPSGRSSSTTWQS
mmetsp:Transcript_18813/g.43554  ORF Transcript_18813/g.43554 Transcript_18813/m.43554 type:complete len:210 (+) Transcript_18813:1761-2390(+)